MPARWPGPTEATAAAMERDEELLVGKARDLRIAGFLRVLAYWSQCADPDGTEDRAARQVEGRRFHLGAALLEGLRSDGNIPVGVA